MIKDLIYITVIMGLIASFVVFTNYMRPGDLTALNCPVIECGESIIFNESKIANVCPLCECPKYSNYCEPIQCPPCEQLSTQDKAAKLILNMRPSSELSECAQYGWAIAKKQFIRDLDIPNAPKYGDFPIYTPETKCFTSNESLFLLQKYYDGQNYYFIVDESKFNVNKSGSKIYYYQK